jgi:predicted TIM-barrel fold metal-dependent hydrolase
MQTAWGDVEVADAHVHFFSNFFFRSLAEQKALAGGAEAVATALGWEAPADNTELAARWAGELDRHGVSRAALIASLPGDETSVGGALRAQSDRFYGFFMFNPMATGTAERAIRAFEELRLQGLCLFPAMHRFSVQDDRLRPIYELAGRQKNVVVFVHTGVLTVGFRKKLDLPSKFSMSFSNPIDLHSVALDFPHVNFVVPHFGAGYFREALMLGDLAPNIYLDTSSTNSWMKYLLPDVTLKDVFRRALDVYGPNRLLFGTDSSFFPRGWNRSIFDAQAKALEELKVDEQAARAIFGGNLKRLMGA